jgi:hypothetical protein
VSETPQFAKGRKYRVRRDYNFLNRRFRAGEIVTFTEEGYAAYDGVTRYWFEHGDSSEKDAWHVFDTESDKTDWAELFEPV